MVVYGLVFGLFSFLTPVIFPFIFIIGIGYQKLATSNTKYWINSFVLLFTISCIYAIFIFEFDDIIKLDYLVLLLIYFKIIYVLIMLVFSLALIGFFNIAYKIKIVFGILVSILIGIEFSALFIRMSLPMYGSLLANDNHVDFSMLYFGEILAVSAILIMILLLSRRLHTKYKDKSWSENISKLLGLYIFITQIFSILKMFNVNF